MNQLINDLVKSLKWLTIVKIISQLLTWVITIVVIKLLEPKDYGLMATAMIFISFLSLISEMGLSASIIQAKNLTDNELKQMFGILLIAGFSLFVMLFFSSSLISIFFENQKLTLIIKFLSLQFILISLLTIPKSYLEKNLRFKEKSIIDFFSNFIGSITTLIIALHTPCVWALVMGSFTVILCQTIGYNIVYPICFFPKFRFSNIKKYISFSGYVALNRVVWYLYSQSDLIIIGKLCGQEILGYYSVAIHLSSLIIQKISPIITQVTFPFYSKLQAKKDLITVYYIKSVGLSGLLFIPAFLGLYSVSTEFIYLILGTKWINIILPLKILCLSMPLRLLGTLNMPPLQALGRADIALINIVCIASFMIPSFYIFAFSWGMLGVCYAWLLIYPVCFIINLVITKTILKFSLLGYLKEIYVQIISSVLMSVTLYVIENYFIIYKLQALILKTIIGVLLYLFYIILLDKTLLINYRSLLFKKGN